MLRQLDELRITTGATHIKRLLFEHGFRYAWLANEIGDSLHFMKLFKQRINYISMQSRHCKLLKSPKSIYYKEFKSMLETETYLSVNMSFPQRRILANFRCSNPSLTIETGRHDNIDREYRLCKLIHYRRRVPFSFSMPFVLQH